MVGSSLETLHNRRRHRAASVRNLAVQAKERALSWKPPVEAPKHFTCPITAVGDPPSHPLVTGNPCSRPLFTLRLRLCSRSCPPLSSAFPQVTFEDPVLCSDGHTYERVAMEELHTRFLMDVVANPRLTFNSPLSGQAMPDTEFLENKFAKEAIAEFALEFPELVQREEGALDEYRRWKMEREERIAAEEAEEEQDISAEPVRRRMEGTSISRLTCSACLRFESGMAGGGA